MMNDSNLRELLESGSKLEIDRFLYELTGNYNSARCLGYILRELVISPSGRFFVFTTPPSDRDNELYRIKGSLMEKLGLSRSSVFRILDSFSHCKGRKGPVRADMLGTLRRLICRENRGREGTLFRVNKEACERFFYDCEEVFDWEMPGKSFRGEDEPGLSHSGSSGWSGDVDKFRKDFMELTSKLFPNMNIGDDDRADVVDLLLIETWNYVQNKNYKEMLKPADMYRYIWSYVTNRYAGDGRYFLYDVRWLKLCSYMEVDPVRKSEFSASGKPLRELVESLFSRLKTARISLKVYVDLFKKYRLENPLMHNSPEAALNPRIIETILKGIG